MTDIAMDWYTQLLYKHIASIPLIKLLNITDLTTTQITTIDAEEVIQLFKDH